jgi:hypothetical protein
MLIHGQASEGSRDNANGLFWFRECAPPSVGSCRGRQSVGHEVDADIGVARVGPTRRVLGRGAWRHAPAQAVQIRKCR